MSQTLTNEQIDAELDAIHRERELVLAPPRTAVCCRRLAELANREATWWEALAEYSPIRVHWRAALAARQHALDTARRWQARAEVFEESEAQSTAPRESEAA